MYVWMDGWMNIAWVLCENCVNGCTLECLPISNNGCMMELSPYHGPCVTLEAPERSFLSTSSELNQSFSMIFYTVISFGLIQNFFVGLVLYFGSQKLAKSRSFHYFLGASIAICLSALLALYFVSRQARNTTKMIPGMQLLESIGTFIVPFTSVVFMPLIQQIASWCMRYLNFVWSSESFFGIPHLGKLYFIFFGFVGLFLVWWNQWGVSNNNNNNNKNLLKEEKKYEKEEEEEEEEEEEDDFEFMTLTQQRLARFLQFVGMIFLFYSTSSTEASMVLLFLVLSSRIVFFIGRFIYFWYYADIPCQHTMHQLTKEEFEMEGKIETQKALAELQIFLQENPFFLEKVKEENEIRLRRFTNGSRNHMDVTTKNQEQKSSSFTSFKEHSMALFRASFCSIQ
jgi:hypothetical protein